VGKNKKTVPTPVAAGPRGKRPVAHTPGTSVAGRHPVFSFRFADRTYDGSWGFNRSADESHTVAELMCNMGALTWSEIYSQTTGGRRRRKKHHDQPLAGLCKEAQDRIAHLRLDEVIDDRVFRFRHGGTGRLWGWQVEDIFFVLWWDPDHQVFPTEG
jgi:hypothetical protein